ncbi:MAG TPA: NHL repeat-containing protein, partial [Vicinamibacterales bacterium]|nr:NHL repeat-containing protein [Vicinamibacterales bacterium]
MALLAIAPGLRGLTVHAQSATEIWQVVFAVPGVTGLPAVPAPNPGLAFPSGLASVPATNLSGQPLPLAGDIVVADTWNNMIRAFDPTTGAETLSLGSPSSTYFNQPAQVKVDANGLLVVTDTYNNAVEIFNADGTPDNLLTGPDGSPTNRLTGFDWPKGIAMTPGTAIGVPNTGTIAVISSGNFTKPSSIIDVQVFNSMLQPLFSFGEPTNPSKPGQLHAPLAVAIDPTTGDFLVTDTATGTTPAQVLVYDSTGNYLFSFTNPSTDPTGPMSFPIDIAVEPGSGRVLVADAGTSVIYFFTVDYAAQTATEDFAISGSNTPIQFLSPGGLGFNAKGQLLVTTGTYNSNFSSYDPTTQFILVFDRPSLAISNVAVANNGVPVTAAVTPGTTLDFTVTLSSPSGTVSSVSVAGSLTDLSGTQVSLGTASPTGGNVTAGTPETVSFSYTVPSTTTQGNLSFTATATGTINSGTATSASVTTTSLPLAVAVVPSGGDTTAPTITAALSPASPQSPPWYNTPVQVTLAATDNTGGSGVKEIDYYFVGAQTLIDHGTAFFPDQVLASSAAPLIDQDGTTTLYYRAVDNAGNASAYQQLTVQVDQTPPYVQSFKVSPAATG